MTTPENPRKKDLQEVLIELGINPSLRDGSCARTKEDKQRVKIMYRSGEKLVVINIDDVKKEPFEVSPEDLEALK